MEKRGFGRRSPISGGLGYSSHVDMKSYKPVNLHHVNHEGVTSFSQQIEFQRNTKPQNIFKFIFPLLIYNSTHSHFVHIGAPPDSAWPSRNNHNPQILWIFEIFYLFSFYS
jgi:hypothetical protein